MVYKKITMIGTSEDGFEAATDAAIDRAEETLDNVKWITTQHFGVQLDDSGNREYQSEVEITFELDE